MPDSYSDPDPFNFMTSTTLDDQLQRPPQFDGGSRGMSYNMKNLGQSIDVVFTKAEKLTKILKQGEFEKWAKTIKHLAKHTKDLADQQERYSKAVTASTGGGLGTSSGNGGTVSGLPAAPNSPNGGQQTGLVPAIPPPGSRYSPSTEARGRGGQPNGGGHISLGQAATGVGVSALYAASRYSDATAERAITGDLLYNQLAVSAFNNGGVGNPSERSLRAGANQRRLGYATNPYLASGALNSQEFERSLGMLRNGGLGGYRNNPNLQTLTGGANLVATMTGVSHNQGAQEIGQLYSPQAAHALRANGISSRFDGSLQSTAGIAQQLSQLVANRARQAGQDISNPAVVNQIIAALNTEGTVASRGLAEITGGVGTSLHQSVTEMVGGYLNQGNSYNPYSQRGLNSTGVGSSIMEDLYRGGDDRRRRNVAEDIGGIPGRRSAEAQRAFVNDILADTGIATAAAYLANTLSPLGDIVSRVTGALSGLFLFLAGRGVGIFGRGARPSPVPPTTPLPPPPGGVGPGVPRGPAPMSPPMGGGLRGFIGMAGMITGVALTSAGGVNRRETVEDIYRELVEYNGWPEGAATRLRAQQYFEELGEFRREQESLSWRERQQNKGNAPVLPAYSSPKVRVGDPPLPGMDSRLSKGVSTLMAMNPRLQLNSGARGAAQQAALFSAGVTNVPPGHPESRHERGLAADLGPDSELGWLRKMAPKVGLEFPHRGEPWHVEVAGTRGDFSKYRSEMGGGGMGSSDYRVGTPMPLENAPASVRANETVTALTAYLKSTVPEGVATNGYRQGSSTYHGKAQAVDMRVTPSDEGYADPGMRKIFTAFGQISGSLKELFLADAPFYVSGGTVKQGRLPNTLYSAHKNHVHAATDNKNLPGGGSTGGGTGSSPTEESRVRMLGSSGAPKSRYGSVSEKEYTESLLTNGPAAAIGVNKTSTGQGRTTPVGGGSEIEKFLFGLRTIESSNNYTAENDYSTASGAYQYLTGTWNNYGGYATAGQAPPAIQDQRARADRLRAFQKYGSWRASAVDHIYPAYADDPNEWNITLPGHNAGHTGNTYASKVLSAAGLVGDPPLPEMPIGFRSLSAPGQGGGSSGISFSPAGGTAMGSGVGYGHGGGGGGHGKCIHIDTLELHAQLPNGHEVIRMIEAVEAHADRKLMVDKIASS